MKNFSIKCFIIILIFLLTGCKENNPTYENQLVSFHTTNGKEANDSNLDASVINPTTITPTVLPIINTPTLSPEQKQQSDFNSLCDKYSAMLDKASEINRVDDFLYCVDSMNNHIRVQIESNKWKDQTNMHPDKSLLPFEIDKLKNGELVKLPSDGAYIDFDFDGIQEEFVFAYDPDITKHQEYRMLINGDEVTSYAHELYGELYVFSLESEIGNHVYIAVVENGPHGDSRSTDIWTYWENKPYILGKIKAPPEEVTIESFNENSVLTYTKYFLISDTYCAYTAHVFINYNSDNDVNQVLELKELSQNFYTLNQTCNLKKNINLYSQKDLASDLVSVTTKYKINLVGIAFDDDWLCFSIIDQNNHSYEVWASYNSSKNEILIDNKWVSLNDILNFH